MNKINYIEITIENFLTKQQQQLLLSMDMIESVIGYGSFISIILKEVDKSFFPYQNKSIELYYQDSTEILNLAEGEPIENFVEKKLNNSIKRKTRTTETEKTRLKQATNLSYEFLKYQEKQSEYLYRKMRLWTIPKETRIYLIDIFKTSSIPIKFF